MQTFSLYENSIPLSVSDFFPTLTYYEPKEKKENLPSSFFQAELTECVPFTRVKAMQNSFRKTE